MLATPILGGLVTNLNISIFEWAAIIELGQWVELLERNPSVTLLERQTLWGCCYNVVHNSCGWNTVTKFGQHVQFSGKTLENFPPYVLVTLLLHDQVASTSLCIFSYRWAATIKFGKQLHLVVYCRELMQVSGISSRDLKQLGFLVSCAKELTVAKCTFK